MIIKIKKLYQYLILVIFSIMLIPIWGLSSLSVDFANIYLCFLAFLFTGFTVAFIKKCFSVSNKLVLFSGPLFYLGVAIYSLVIYEQSIVNCLFNPIIWFFIQFFMAYFIKNKRVLIVSLVSVSVFYSFVLWKNEDYFEYKFREIPAINEHNNLSDFYFINNKFDTVKLANVNKTIIVETWNEACKPCIAAIKDVQELSSKDTSVLHVYLYHNINDSQITAEGIYNFDQINNKDHILVDVNNSFVKAFELETYPFFIVFNKEAKLVGYMSGYNSNYKDDMIGKLKELIDKAKAI